MGRFKYLILSVETHTMGTDNTKAALELGTKPIGKLLVQYATPAIIAMMASSLYNTVDCIFIGHGVGPLGVSGLALTFPLMNLSAAIGAAVGVGSSTYISVKLGQKDYKTAQRIFGNSVSLNIVLGIIFGAAFLVFLDPMLYFFGASDNTIPYARAYLIMIMVGNPITHLYFGLNNTLRAIGKPRQAMYATVFTVLFNTALDPIFIYALGMGIQGASTATILSQTVAMLWQVKIFSGQNELVHFKRGIYGLRAELVKNIIGIGMSPFCMNACACIVGVFLNTSLAKYGGDFAVGAYGIGNKVAFIFLMVVMGINQGMQPIAGYNYGAGHTVRLMKVVKLAMAAATTVTTIAFLIGEFCPYPLARMFTDDPELTRLSIHAIRMMVLAFPVVGFQMVTTNFFQSIGKVKISIFLGLSRQMIFLIPLIVILPLFFGIDGVWASLPLSDAITAITAGVIMTIFMRKFKKQAQ